MSKPTNDDVPYKCDTFSVAEIKAANERHDRTNGWSPRFAHCFTNLMRHPESTFAPAERAFERSPLVDGNASLAR